MRCDIVSLLLSSRLWAFILDYLMLGFLFCKSSFVCVLQLWFKRCSLLVLLLSVHAAYAVRDTEWYQCCLLNETALHAYKTWLLWTRKWNNLLWQHYPIYNRWKFISNFLLTALSVCIYFVILAAMDADKKDLIIKFLFWS